MPHLVPSFFVTYKQRAGKKPARCLYVEIKPFILSQRIECPNIESSSLSIDDLKKLVQLVYTQKPNTIPLSF